MKLTNIAKLEKYHRKLLLAILALLLVVSCDLFRQKVSGTVTYLAEGTGFPQADNIKYKDVNGHWNDTGVVSLPWNYSYSFSDIYTGDLDPAAFRVVISSQTNTSGGTLHTKAHFTTSYNDPPIEETNNYAPNVAIDQYAACHITSNNF